MQSSCYEYCQHAGCVCFVLTSVLSIQHAEAWAHNCGSTAQKSRNLAFSVLMGLAVLPHPDKHWLALRCRGTVGLDFFDGCDEYDLPPNTPILLLIHGLAGSSEDGAHKSGIIAVMRPEL